MKKIICAVLVLTMVVATAAMMTGCGEKTKELNIITWVDYTPQDVMEQFEEETGIRVNAKYVSSNEEMLVILREQKNTYDVVVCSDAVIDLMIREGKLVQKLNKAQIPNFKNIAPQYQSNYYDPDNEYTVPHAAYEPILVYNTEKSPIEIKGYNDLWNPALKNSVVVIDDLRGVIGMTAQAMGGSINETDPAVLESVKAKLMELRPNIIAFDADRPHEAMLRGDAVAGYMFGSQATAAMAENPAITYVYPEEGFSTGIDCYVVAYGAPNKANAMKFLDFILQGEVSAHISEQINYTNCNTEAKPFLPAEFLANPTFNIPAEKLVGAQFYQDLGDAQLIYDKMWTEFKSR